MNSGRMILVDRFIGIPVAVCMNLFARILGAVLRRDHAADPEKVRNIVIAKFVGMGSIIQATSLTRSLKEKYPNARITLVTDKSNSALLGRVPSIDAAITVDKGSPVKLVATMAALLARLWKLRADLYFDLELYSAFASVIALMSLSRNRYGFYRQNTNFKSGIYTHLIYFNTRMPIRHIYEQLGAAAGCEGKSDGLPPLALPEADTAEAGKTVNRHAPDAGGSYIAINVNASDLLIERRWPAEHFASLMEMIARKDRPVFLVGAPSERAYVEEVLSLVTGEAKNHCHNTAGEMSIGGLFGLLKNASALVTNDTGPMHMAFALGTPVVCLFGPGSPDHYTIRNSRSVTISSPVYCSPCLYEIAHPPCGGDNVCMQLISPKTVCEELEKLLTGKLPDTGRSREYIYEAKGKPLGLLVRDSIAYE